MSLLVLDSCLRTTSAKSSQQLNVTEMSTTTELFGITPQEHAAAVFTALGEAGPGKDLYGPYSTLLNRKLSGGYGKDIVRMAVAPQQFVANAGRSSTQISDPEFGKKIYGSRYTQAYNDLNNPNKLAPVFEQLKGATSFRGQSLLGNKQKGDVMLDPKGNFYFDYKPAVQQKGSKILSSTGLASAPTTSAPPSQQGSPASTYNIYLNGTQEEGLDFLSSYLPKLTGQQDKPKSMFDPLAMLSSAFNTDYSK